ncbi:MAG: hypothetical protein R2684_13435 [Pyrinomonadaceae bacterium]
MESSETAREDLLMEVLMILKETFEGSPPGQGSIYLDRGVSIENTLSRVSFEDASKDRNGTTIAAHTEHLKFYIDRLVEYMNGRTEPVHWDQSWLIETVSEDEWSILREGLKDSYLNAIEQVAEFRDKGEYKAGELTAIVAHTAYHLGAIRQMAKG